MATPAQIKYARDLVAQLIPVTPEEADQAVALELQDWHAASTRVRWINDLIVIVVRASRKGAMAREDFQRRSPGRWELLDSTTMPPGDDTKTEICARLRERQRQLAATTDDELTALSGRDMSRFIDVVRDLTPPGVEQVTE